MKNLTLIWLAIFQSIVIMFMIATGFQALNLEQIIATTKSDLSTTMIIMEDLAKDFPLPKGSKAPSFDLIDENEKIVSLDDYKGKKVLLQFSTSDCANCEPIYSMLDSLTQEQENLEVLIMQLQSTPEANKQFKQQYNISFKVLAANQAEIDNYHLSTIPYSILIDEEGKVTDSERVVTADDFVQFLDLE